MKKLGLVLCGLTPFLFGGLMNWVMMTFSGTVLPFKLIGFVFLLIWFIFSLLFGTKNSKQTILLLNLPAFIVLVLLFIQDIILSAYWRNAVGMWTQLFYLPMLNIGFSLTLWAHRVFAADAASFLLMVLAAFLGCKVRGKTAK